MKFWDETTKHPNCSKCMGPLLDVAGKGVHPLCDRSDEVWWTPEEMAVWLEAAVLPVEIDENEPGG
ncbi:hypothetical protein C8D88_11696 [Lentzea atacamensis]|uniref:Uncharacterized protein n=1 Tax=Lentzea atacamensis TaxID=531938 RepID=A0A316HLU6_9PSEU|nr:hypothetical protein [Lentzea atacamensis]PWK81685.1 hypothetical protein C8D88_11696 [Lentzea atacamensis]